MADTYNGYCVKCREKRDFEGEVKELANGSKAAQGACPVCGTKMSRMLPKHAEQPPHLERAALWGGLSASGLRAVSGSAERSPAGGTERPATRPAPTARRLLRRSHRVLASSSGGT